MKRDMCGQKFTTGMKPIRPFQGLSVSLSNLPRGVPTLLPGTLGSLCQWDPNIVVLKTQSPQNRWNFYEPSSRTWPDESSWNWLWAPGDRRENSLKLWQWSSWEADHPSPAVIWPWAIPGWFRWPAAARLESRARMSCVNRLERLSWASWSARVTWGPQQQPPPKQETTSTLSLSISMVLFSPPGEQRAVKEKSSCFHKNLNGF